VAEKAAERKLIAQNKVFGCDRENALLKVAFPKYIY
jgi:hypothetical protein